MDDADFSLKYWEVPHLYQDINSKSSMFFNRRNVPMTMHVSMCVYAVWCVDGQKVVLFALDSRGKWLAGML